MKFVPLFILLCCSLAQAANTIDDMFPVKSIEANQAILKGGVTKGLKVGDTLYFNRTPFQFKITAVNDSTVTIELPAIHDLKVGNALVRHADEFMQRAIASETAVNKAFEGE